MELAAYENLWTNCIKPRIDIMLSADDDIMFAQGRIKENIWLTYENYKNIAHTYLHDPDGRIDRHKVASIMLYSIISNKPFELKLLPVSRKISNSSLLANEILAFNVSLNIVLSFLLDDARLKSDNTKLDIFKNGFVFPKCQHDSYESNIYKMLYYSKINNRYDIFAFAHILFLIEAYTEYVRKTELAGKVL